jgi:hypothetical protein
MLYTKTLTEYQIDQCTHRLVKSFFFLYVEFTCFDELPKWLTGLTDSEPVAIR